jgi:glycerol-3-phosphate dehydrogenase subunit B
MNERLREACSQQRIRMFLNSKAVGLVAEGSRVTAVKVAVAGATKEVPADYVIYAAGGLDSGAIELDSHRELHDTVFGLPVAHENELLHGDFWGEPQPLYAAGLNVDEQMRPTGEKGPVYTNLYAVGDMLAGAYRAREKSGEGIAIGSAAQAVASIMRSEA